MKTAQSELVSTLRQTANAVRQELAQVEGRSRALPPEEKEQFENLQQLLESMEPFLDDSMSPQTNGKTAETIVLRDGRYAAANPQYQAELRIDTTQTCIISMDVYQESGGTRTFLASLRSAPGKGVCSGQRRIRIIGEDENGNQASGIMELNPLSETQATITLRLDNGLYMLPVQVPLVLSANWQSTRFRTIGLEVDVEANVPALPSVVFEGRTITIDTCFEDAGLEVLRAGQRDVIPRPGSPWDDAQLHGLMVRFGQENLSQRGWFLHLLMLSESRLGGLLGVMFDTGEQDANSLPRQGAAVFVKPMENHPAGFQRKLIQTIVHELGHALNLAHRFERSVSRADSTSFMNYDWRYFGGNRAEQFWRDFRFAFDADEIRFLRHAPWPGIVPGGAEFHTINYWSDGTGGYSPYAPEVPLPGLELVLHAPPEGALFSFGQPVLLTVELKNTSGHTLNIPSYLLDPKTGFLELMVRRLGARRRRLPEDLEPFIPIMTRCWDVGQVSADIVPNGGSMTNNVNLTFGSAGFTFAEPGTYEITAVLSVFDQTRQVDQIVRSQPLRIRVAYPRSLQEEQDVMALFRKDIGYYLVLGGSDVLTKAAETLEEIRQRRQGKARPITDPLAAHIVRCQAINLARDFVRYEDGQYRTRSAKLEEAADKLDRLETAKQFFDPNTQKGNRALRDRLQESLRKHRSKHQ